MKRTALKDHYLHAALVAVLAAGIVEPSSAEIVYPPDHLHRSARFVAHTTSVEKFRIPWYHTNGAEARERLIAEETQTKSPHPSSYYFAGMRSFGNPSSQRPNGFQESEAATEIKIVDKSAFRGDES